MRENPSQANTAPSDFRLPHKLRRRRAHTAEVAGAAGHGASMHRCESINSIE